MGRKIQVPATLEGVSTLKDGGCSIRFHTQELTAAEKAVAFDFQSQFGWLLFAETEHKEDDVKQLEHIRKDTGGKSPSQRLRSSLYVMYQQKSDKSIPFEVFYGQQMEKIINSVKSNLD